jgi:hypothetical protein
LDGSSRRMPVIDFYKLVGTPTGITPNPPSSGEALASPAAPNVLWWF